MAETDPNAELDADGITVQKFLSRVLFVCPQAEFADECLRYARSSLHNVHVGSWTVSTDTQELVKGRHQDEFMVDGPLAGASMDEYAGVIFVGGEGAPSLTSDPDALRLAREAAAAGKLIGAWGYSVSILAAADVVRGRRVTGDVSLKDAVRKAGGKFTGRQLEVQDNLITALDDAAGMRFGKALAAHVGI